MSRQNHLDQKRIRRAERLERNKAAGNRSAIPFAGVVTTKKIVLGQRYLAVKRLPFSSLIAAVFIGPEVGAKP